MSEPSKAVFLSYASQDAEAAKKICDALRSAGVEVWFDQEGGLEHGDEWDAKIRRQIRECVLFIPLISANTQARHEGYFRIEWELAAQRALGIASGVPFILPVVTDGTREPDALVPDRFRMVQWTKLPGGNVPADVLQRFLKLWSHRTGVLKHEAARLAEGDLAAPLRPASRSWLYVGVAALACAGIIGAGWGWFRAGRSAAVASAPVPTPATSSEAEQLVKQARDLIYDPDSARNEFALAEGMLKRATELAPALADAWGASALLNHYFYTRAYDSDPQRLTRSIAEAEKALRLNPRNTDGLLALGSHRLFMGETDRAKPFLEQAYAIDPLNQKVVVAIGYQNKDYLDRARFLRDQAPRLPHPAEVYYYAANDFDFASHWDEAREMNDRAVATQPFWRALVQGAVIEYSSKADPDLMDAWLNRVPEVKRDEPRVALMRYFQAALRRDGAAAVRVLTAVSADYLEDNFFRGPKAYLLASAYELAGQPGLALEQWRIAEPMTRARIAANPARLSLRAMLAVILAAQHRTDEARQVAAECATDPRLRADWPAQEALAEAYTRLGEPDRAIELLGWEHSTDIPRGVVSAATLAAEPRWDSLRSRPGYPALLESMRRTENGGRSATTAQKVDDKSVAVLAFANLSDDKANEYFSDGISEELLNVLAKVPGLKVSARTSAFYFKGKDVPIPEIAQKLGVAYIVEGSVRKAGDKVRITAQLIKAADGFHVWSDTFTRDLKDVFAVQDEIAGLVAKQLSLEMGVRTGAPAAAVNPQAFELYVQARQAWNLRTLEGFDQSEELLNRALAIEPNFARAYAALANVWSTRGGLKGIFGPFNERNSPEFARVQAAIDRALALQPDLGEAYVAKGSMENAMWRSADAERSLRRAIALNPGDATAHQFLGRVLIADGRPDESVAEMKLAAELDPMSHRILDNYAIALRMVGRPADALVMDERALALQPTSYQAMVWRALDLTALGRHAEALEQIRRLPPESGYGHFIAQIYMAAGLKAEAEGAASRHSTERAFGMAALGRWDDVLAELEAGHLSIANAGSLMITPLFDPVRSNPRFPRALDRLGLTEAYARAQAWRAAHPLTKKQATQ